MVEKGAIQELQPWRGSEQNGMERKHLNRHNDACSCAQTGVAKQSR
jgi:hypothetical protein